MKAPQPEEESVGELLQRLVSDGKSYARAELDYYRALAGSKLGDARAALIFALAAVLLGLAALVALAVGLVLTLAPLAGPGPATLIVVLFFSAAAALLGWLAWKHIRRMIGTRP